MKEKAAHDHEKEQIKAIVARAPKLTPEAAKWLRRLFQYGTPRAGRRAPDPPHTPDLPEISTE